MRQPSTRTDGLMETAGPHGAPAPMSGAPRRLGVKPPGLERRIGGAAERSCSPRRSRTCAGCGRPGAAGASLVVTAGLQRASTRTIDNHGDSGLRHWVAPSPRIAWVRAPGAAASPPNDEETRVSWLLVRLGAAAGCG